MLRRVANIHNHIAGVGAVPAAGAADGLVSDMAVRNVASNAKREENVREWHT